MSRIFLSYSSRDRALAAQVATQLTERGLSVWHDGALQAGAGYRMTIRNALDDAYVVCVLWTAAATRSAWVKDEAGTGNGRGRLFSVTCGKVSVPNVFRHSVFGRIRRPEHGPTASELAHLARGLSHMLAASQAEDKFSVRRLASRLADFLSTSAVFALLIAALMLRMKNPSAAFFLSSPLILGLVLTLVGMVMGGVGYASARLCDHLAMRYLSTNVGPSIARLMYRWCGEGAGCAIVVMLAIALKGRMTYLAVQGLHYALNFAGLLIAVWLLIMIGLAVKYVPFIACTRCRYLLLT